MKTKNLWNQRQGKISFFKWVGNKINSFFQPEEVEVTFNSEGKHVKYTYTKVSHKQVA